MKSKTPLTDAASAEFAKAHGFPQLVGVSYEFAAEMELQIYTSLQLANKYEIELYDAKALLREVSQFGGKASAFLSKGKPRNISEKERGRRAESARKLNKNKK